MPIYEWHVYFHFVVVSETAVLVFRNELLRTVDLTVWKDTQRKDWILQTQWILTIYLKRCIRRLFLRMKLHQGWPETKSRKYREIFEVKSRENHKCGTTGLINLIALNLIWTYLDLIFFHEMGLCISCTTLYVPSPKTDWNMCPEG